MAVRTILIGFGNVGRELVKVLASRGEEIEKIYYARLSIEAIVTSRGYATLGSDWRRKAIDLASRYEKGERGFLSHDKDLWEVIDDLSPDLVFIAIPPSYGSGDPNLSIYRGLISRGVSIITADKTGLALEYRELIDSARNRGVYLGYRATVMAGTPAIDVIRGLRGRVITTIRGIFNATTNYILSLVEKSLSYREAIARAVDEKLTEPDPRIDTEGLDPAAKLAILASEAGMIVRLNDIKRSPLTSVSEEHVRSALRRGTRVKYIAEARFSEGILEVAPRTLEQGDPLSSISGSYNGLSIDVEKERITITGPAGPAWRTANVMLTDLIWYIHSKI